MFCQEVQRLFLKRKGVEPSNRWWAMITYAKYDESDRRTYSIELMECEEKAVPEYFQVFNHKYPFQSNLSILDLLFNEGPATLSYLESI